MKRKIVSGIVLAMILTTFMLEFQCQIVQAYVSTPVESRQLYDVTNGGLCACCGFVTRYDYEEGAVNNPYFFPAIECHVNTASAYWIYNVKITVSGTKPDGSAINGLEFCDLGYLTSPHDTGTEWYYALTAIFNVIKKLDPTGATSLLVFGQTEGAGTGCNSVSAWAEWSVPILSAPQNKGLQFRFALHCDPKSFWNLHAQP